MPRSLTGIIDRLDRAISRLHAVTSVLSAVVITAIVLMVMVDIAGRAFFNSSTSGTMEISEVAIVAAVFLVLGVAQAEGRHIAIGLLSDRLRSGAQRVVRGLALAISAIFVAWLIWVCADVALVSLEARESRFGVREVPVWPARIFVAVGLLLWLLEVVRQLVAVLWLGAEMAPAEQIGAE